MNNSNPLHTPSRMLCVAAFGLLATACGRDNSSEDFRLAGAGLDPQTIGPEPTLHGGLVEYNWVNFAGAGLPLSVLGLASFTEAGPDLSSFAPPYAAVTGFAYMFETDEPAPETLFGSWSPPPTVEGSCYTNYDPRSFISSLVDVGNEVRFRAEDADTFYRIGRRPLLYGPNAESAFPVYFAFETWRNEALYYKVFPDGSNELSDYDEKLAFGRNFPHGELVEISFPGAIPPEEASFGSIPAPLASAGENQLMRLPSRSDSIIVQWDGPLYDSRGDLADADAATRTTCLSYAAPDGELANPDDCLEPTAPIDTPAGQVYTGPWETPSDKVSFYYTAPTGDDGQALDEVISVSVRFLGPLDRDDEYKREYVVEVAPPDTVVDGWEAGYGASIPEGMEPANGRRAAVACEDEDDGAAWLLDDDLFDANESPVLALNGEPSHRLAEVTCLMPAPEPGRTAQFDLTMDMIQDAYDYAADHGAEGALFYVKRGTSMNLVTPPVRDAYGNLRETSPVKVVSNAVTLGRFHYDAQ